MKQVLFKFGFKKWQSSNFGGPEGESSRAGKAERLKALSLC